MPGEYSESVDLKNNSGEEGNLITVISQDNTNKPIITGGVNVSDCSYMLFKGFEITVTQIRVDGEGAHNNIFENLDIHHITVCSSALQGFSFHDLCHDNLVLNCDMHHNQLFTGSNADGLGFWAGVPSSTNGPYDNTVRYCRSYFNNDDGFDTWCSQANNRFEYCWAYGNGKDSDFNDIEGDGNGFKLGQGEYNHPVVVNCLAWSNKAIGFDENSNQAGGISVYNSTAYNNGTDFAFWTTGTPQINRVVNCIVVADGNVSMEGAQDIYNNWNLGIVAKPEEFITLDFSANMGPRKADGSLPNSNFLHLVSGSNLIDKGTDVGLPYNGVAPDLGAFEYGGISSLYANFTADTTNCSSVVLFTNTSSQTATSYSWKFGDGEESLDENPSHIYSNPGKYTVELIVTDGNGYDSEKKDIIVSFTPIPINTSAKKNSNGTVTLSATATGVINWYETFESVNILGTGDIFTTDVTDKTIFYTENVIGGTTALAGAKKDKGDGDYYEWNDDIAVWGVRFSTKYDMLLKSVKVYNGESSKGSYIGDRMFFVKNSMGDTVSTVTVKVKDGEQRLDLNMYIPAGDNYRLLADNHVGLWRDKGSAVYPYMVGDNIIISGGVRYDGVPPVNKNDYFFFYDWVVDEIIPICSSERVSVNITSLDDDLTNNEIIIYPNPTKSYINISNLPTDNCIISIYDINMQQVKSIQSNGSTNLRIDFNELLSGVYFCKILLNNNIMIIKKIINIK